MLHARSQAKQSPLGINSKNFIKVNKFVVPNLNHQRQSNGAHPYQNLRKSPGNGEMGIIQTYRNYEQNQLHQSQSNTLTLTDEKDQEMRDQIKESDRNKVSKKGILRDKSNLHQLSVQTKNTETGTLLDEHTLKTSFPDQTPGSGLIVPNFKQATQSPDNYKFGKLVAGSQPYNWRPTQQTTLIKVPTELPDIKGKMNNVNAVTTQLNSGMQSVGSASVIKDDKKKTQRTSDSNCNKIEPSMISTDEKTIEQLIRKQSNQNLKTAATPERKKDLIVGDQDKVSSSHKFSKKQNLLKMSTKIKKKVDPHEQHSNCSTPEQDKSRFLQKKTQEDYYKPKNPYKNRLLNHTNQIVILPQTATIDVREYKNASENSILRKSKNLDEEILMKTRQIKPNPPQSIQSQKLQERFAKHSQRLRCQANWSLSPERLAQIQQGKKTLLQAYNQNQFLDQKHYFDSSSLGGSNQYDSKAFQERRFSSTGSSMFNVRIGVMNQSGYQTGEGSWATSPKKIPLQPRDYQNMSNENLNNGDGSCFNLDPVLIKRLEPMLHSSSTAFTRYNQSKLKQTENVEIQTNSPPTAPEKQETQLLSQTRKQSSVENENLTLLQSSAGDPIDQIDQNEELNTNGAVEKTGNTNKSGKTSGQSKMGRQKIDFEKRSFRLGSTNQTNVIHPGVLSVNEMAPMWLKSGVSGQNSQRGQLGGSKSLNNFDKGLNNTGISNRTGDSINIKNQNQISFVENKRVQKNPRFNKTKDMSREMVNACLSPDIYFELKEKQ